MERRTLATGVTRGLHHINLIKTNPPETSRNILTPSVSTAYRTLPVAHCCRNRPAKALPHPRPIPSPTIAPPLQRQPQVFFNRSPSPLLFDPPGPRARPHRHDDSAADVTHLSPSLEAAATRSLLKDGTWKDQKLILKAHRLRRWQMPIIHPQSPGSALFTGAARLPRLRRRLPRHLRHPPPKTSATAPDAADRKRQQRWHCSS